VPGKIRVSALAKELGLTSKEAIEKLTEMGEYVKTASSTVEAPVARKLREAFPGAAPAPAKKAAAKKAAPAKKRAPNPAFMKEMKPSPQLAAVIGDKPAPRTEVTKKVWDYIKKNGLQDKAKKTMINADAKLKEIFKKAQVSMFEMTKLINSHLS
jgi:chromatin remodeling complex protein RSC6